MALAITGGELRRLIRRHKIRIKELSASSGFTMKRIRQVLNSGLSDRNAARDWIQEITGQDPGFDLDRFEWRIPAKE